MNLTLQQIRKLEGMTDEELGGQLHKHTHNNAVEEAYYRAVIGIAVARCLVKLNEILELVVSPAAIIVDEEHPDAIVFEQLVRDGALDRDIVEAASKGLIEPADPLDPGDIALAESINKKYRGVKVK